MLVIGSTTLTVNPALRQLPSSVQVAPQGVLVPRLPQDLALCEQTKLVRRSLAAQRLPVPYIGMAPLFAGHRVYPGRDTDWALMAMGEDPLFDDRDGYPMPWETIDLLRALQRARIEFDGLYSAHEVLKGTVCEDRPIPAEAIMPPPAPGVQRLSAVLGGAMEIGWRIAAGALVLSATLALGAATAAPGSAPSTARLDPILFGAVVAPGRPLVAGEPAGWFLIDGWIW